MIGINYVGHNPGELSGCHNDVFNMLAYIKECHGFEDENITILMDDGNHTEPTSANIMAAYKQLAAETQEGDAVFCHYSGHGCSIKDDDGDEDDGMDEALCPVDYAKAGVLRDDDVFTTLVAPMPKDVLMTVVMDCCHSGTILDLPYTIVGNGEMQEMKLDEGFDFGPLLQLAKMGFEGLKQFHAQGKERRAKRRQRWKNRLGF